jgi:hypothetical protein
MMQSIAGVEIRRGSGSHFYVGIPLFLLCLVLLPFVILLAPVALVACLVLEMNPLRVIRELWRVPISLRGTHLEIEDGANAVVVHIP